MEERKGILTPNQEKGADELWVNKGVMEAVDGPAIKLADNQVIERLKGKIPVEYHSSIYEIVDELFRAFGIEP